MDFNTSIMLHYQSLHRYAGKLTRDREAAADLVQDTIVRALSRQHQYVENGKMSSWLLAIMHNQFVNGCRSTNRQPFSDEEPPAVAIGGGQEERVLASQVTEAIRQFPPSWQRLLLSHAIGHRYDEMALQQGLPLGTVRSRLHRSHTQLREMFK